MVAFVWLWDLNDGRFSVSVIFICYMISNTVGFVSLIFYEISKTVRFVLLWDFNDRRFVWLRNLNDGRFTVSIVFFCYKILNTVGFVSMFTYKISKTVGFVALQVFNDGRFYSVMRFQLRLLFFFFITRFQWHSVLFPHKISMTSVLFGYEISIMVAFVWLRDLNDGRFSVSVVFFCYMISNTVGFKDNRFCWVASFQWWSVLFGSKISMMVGLVLLQNLNDGRFSGVSHLFIYFSF